MESPVGPALFSLPLVGHSSLLRTFRDPQSWAEAVCVSTPVRICEPRRPSRPFLNQSAVLALGELVVVATQGSAISLVTEEHPTAQLLVPYRGNGYWGLEGRIYSNPFQESVLYLPPAPLSLENDITSGVAVNLKPAALVQTAWTMAGPEGLSPAQLMVFQQPRRVLLDDPRAARLIQGLYGTLMTLDQVTENTGTAAELLRLDDVLLRLVVLLLLPELLQDEPGNGRTASSLTARRKLASLLDWIEAHLDQPIGLSDLEAQAHWSRRTVQHLFREAYGCTPMQWVRRRRVHRAMLRLKHPLEGDTVGTISRSTGFPSSATFHRAFRSQFGCSPSSVFRGEADAR